MCSDRPYVVSISQCSLPAPLSVVTSMWILKGGGQHTLAWYRAASYDKVAKSGEGTSYKMHHAPTLEGEAHGAKHSEIPSLPVLMPFDLDESGRAMFLFLL